jgi:hypothetical protein
MTMPSKINELQEEINGLKEELKKPHLTKNSEQDYAIKSKIIDKQNEIIELLYLHINEESR